jgi:hypothetical protein
MPARTAAARTPSEAFRGVGIFQPAVPLAKPGKRRADQGIERSGAGQTFITLRPPRHTVTVDIGPDLHGEKHRIAVVPTAET